MSEQYNEEDELPNIWAIIRLLDDKITAVADIVQRKEPVTVNFTFLDDTKTCIPPSFGSEYASGMDIRSVEEHVLRPGETYAYSTNIAVEIPVGYDIKVHSRSGLAYKNGVFVLNSPGVIDCDYRNEIKVILHNTGKNSFNVCVGDRIAQIILYKTEKMRLYQTTVLSETLRNMNGLGSTGVK